MAVWPCWFRLPRRFVGNAIFTMSSGPALTGTRYRGVMAKLSKPPVPLKMYKHFAAATVTLTLAIALFADDSHQTVREQRETVRQTPQSTPQAAVVRTGSNDEPVLLRRESGGGGSFSSDEGGGYGAPMMSTGSSISSAARRPVSNRHRQALPNMSAGEVAALSEEEYERLRRLYVEAGAIEDEDRSAQMSTAEHASAQRMGHGGSDS